MTDDPMTSAATVYLVLDSRGTVVSVAATKRLADHIKAKHEAHGFGPYTIDGWAVRR